MEEAVRPSNWEAALSAVERNDGAPGPDGMKASQLRKHLGLHGKVIKERLLEGSYRPGAARRRDIAKPNGGTRALSIPNVADRFVQHLLLGVLQPVFEPRFSENSPSAGSGPVGYGFRPMRSAHDAVKAAKAYAEAGLTHGSPARRPPFLAHGPAHHLSRAPPPRSPPPPRWTWTSPSSSTE